MTKPLPDYVQRRANLTQKQRDEECDVVCSCDEEYPQMWCKYMKQQMKVKN